MFSCLVCLSPHTHLFSGFLAWQYSLSTTSAVTCFLLVVVVAVLSPSPDTLSVCRKWRLEPWAEKCNHHRVDTLTNLVINLIVGVLL